MICFPNTLNLSIWVSAVTQIKQIIVNYSVTSRYNTIVENKPCLLISHIKKISRFVYKSIVTFFGINLMNY